MRWGNANQDLIWYAWYPVCALVRKNGLSTHPDDIDYVWVWRENVRAKRAYWQSTWSYEVLNGGTH
jgi:hypothetical protein